MEVDVLGVVIVLVSPLFEVWSLPLAVEIHKARLGDLLPEALCALVSA